MKHQLENTLRVVLLMGMFSCPGSGLAITTTNKPPTLPENLALKAKAWADSEFSDRYTAARAIDGKIAVPGSQEDLDKSWCVKGDTNRENAVFTLEWSNSVTVAEVVYWSRTAWFAEEGWKDYEVLVDDSPAPAAKGRLEMGHGPQRIKLDNPCQVRKLRIQFLSSYGGLNPGAAEIQVFATHPAEGTLAKFHKLSPGRPDDILDETVAEDPELAAGLADGTLGFDRLVLVQRRELNPTHVYTYHVEGFEAGGALCVYHPRTQDLRKLVPSPEGQILDCDVSYDGRELLFSWRKTQKAGYQVFLINADGTDLRQLTDGPHHNYNACWLPDGGIAFLSTRSSRFAYCWVSPVGILHRMDRDGGRVVQLSANIVNDFTPSVMQDGRLIYSRWEYVDKPAIPIQSLWTIHPDGTGLAGFYGNRVLSPATFMEARSVPGSSKVLCVLTSHNGPARGAIGMINPILGNNSQAAIENLTPEVGIGKVDAGDGNQIRGPYESPFPLDARHFLVSKRGMVLVRDYAGQRLAKVIGRQDRLGFYSPQPIRSRPAPPNVASFRSDETQPWATVFLQDVYRGLEPQVKRGEVRQICVVEEMKKAVRTDVANRAFGFQFPVISCGATYACKKVWGYADVEADGSACFLAPTGVPIYFIALDAEGRAVQRMRTFTHLMPGQVQGCVGCHEPRQESTHALRTAATSRKPQALRPPEWQEKLTDGIVGFDYARLVQPVLDQHCVRCHSGPNPPQKVDLVGDKTDFFNVSYEVLARGRRQSGEAQWESPYVSWIPTYNGLEANILEVTPKAWGSPRSKLAEIVVGGHPDAEGKPRVQMDETSRRRILAWIDLNVPYYGTSETAYPDKVGCRRIYPKDLDATLAEVAKRRCAECHQGGKLPRPVWTRITNPQLNGFLLAPLAAGAGGNGRCGKAVFASQDDPDYRKILSLFEPEIRQLAERPRMDMAGAKPALVDRSCLGY